MNKIDPGLMAIIVACSFIIIIASIFVLVQEHKNTTCSKQYGIGYHYAGFNKCSYNIDLYNEIQNKKNNPDKYIEWREE